MAIWRIRGLSMKLTSLKVALPHSLFLAQAVIHLVMDVDAIEKESTHPRALARIVDCHLLQFRCRAVLVQDIEALSTVLCIGNRVEPEMFYVFLLQSIDVPQHRK